MGKKFRIPRKLKKKIKTGLYLYPPDMNGNSVMGFPKKNQSDYTAYKQGILKDRFKRTKSQIKQHSIEWSEKYDKVVEVTDEELLEAVNDVFAKEYRESFYNILLRSKRHNVAIIDYYNFINLYKDGKYSSCCLVLDSAKDNLRRSKPRKRVY